MRTPRGHGQAGFTLVEILVALLIMSLMMVAIIQVLTTTRHVRDVVYNTQESQLAGPAILDLLEADLRALYTTNRRTDDVLRVVDGAISGLDADRIDFVTTTNNKGLIPNSDRTRYLRADVSEVGYCLKANRQYEGEFLEIYRRESFGIDEEPFVGGTYTFLHDRVVRFDILVFSESGADAEPLESWGIENSDAEFKGLPDRLEIELEIELAPRLLREQASPLAGGKRKVVYRRIIAFPESAHLALEVRPVPRIPDIQPPGPNSPELGGPGGTAGPGGGFTSGSGTTGTIGSGSGSSAPVLPLGGSGGGGGGGGGGNPFGGGGG